MSNEKSLRMLIEGSVLKGLLFFALPIFIGQLFQIGYTLVDTKIVGSMLGEDALAAVGAVSTLNNLMTQFIIGVTMGFSVVVSRLFGAKEYITLKRALSNSLIYGMIVSLFITIIVCFSLDSLLMLINVPEDQYQMSKSYIFALTVGLIITFAYNYCANMMRAVGDAYTPLVFLVIATVANVILDVIFVGPGKMGVFGAALATVIAQLISLMLCVIRIRRAFPILRIGRGDFVIDKELTDDLIKGGLSMGLMSCLVNFGTLSLQTGINGLGTRYIVAHTAARKMFEIFLLPIAVLSATMATFSGQNFGAGQYDRIKKGMKTSLIICLFWNVLVLLVCFTVAGKVAGFIVSTSDQNILIWSVRYLKINMSFLMVCSTIIILRNTMQGFGDHVTPVVSSTIELLGKLVFAFVFVRIYDYWGIIWAEPVVWILMCIPLVVMILKNPYLRIGKGLKGN